MIPKILLSALLNMSMQFIGILIRIVAFIILTINALIQGSQSIIIKLKTSSTSYSRNGL